MSQEETRIGTDEWVKSYEERRVAQTGLLGTALRLSQRVPFWGWIGLLLLSGLILPLTTDNPYIIRVYGTITLMATLGMGLNVVVGFAGLLDLGFVAFYGVGGYAYAYLSSDYFANSQFIGTGIHLPTWVTLIVIALLGALFGLLLGSPSLRLVGDYLAIVTLGFGQIFVQLVLSLSRVQLPGIEGSVNLTGGPNGIVNLDSFVLLGFEAGGVFEHYYIRLAAMLLVLVFVYHLNNSRLGRAWRSMREDELAAEVMGMPTRRLKLQAFAIGAAIAAVSGALFASLQGSVFPQNFDVTLLITLYAIIVLGGLGSLPGVLTGAVIMIAVPEVLRNLDLAGAIFYIGVLITLFTVLKHRWQTLLLIAVAAGFGIIVKAALLASSPDTFPALESTGSAFTDAIRNWLPIPEQPIHAGNLAFFALIILVLVVSRVRHTVWRFVLLVPTLYLLAFAWETRLSQEPSITRLIFIGILLVTLMVYRPQGIFGQRRVEIA